MVAARALFRPLKPEEARADVVSAAKDTVRILDGTLEAKISMLVG